MAFQILLSIPYTIWIFLLFFSFGDIVRKTLHYRYDSVPERIIISTSLGFGIIGILIMCLCFVGLATKAGIIILLASLSLLLIFFTIQKLSAIRVFFSQKIPLSKLSFLEYFFLCLLSLYIMRCFLPPSGFDALMYHLSCAKLFLEHGGFFDIFFNPQSDFPMLTEMIFMTGLSLDNDLVCRLTDMITVFITCGTLFLFCRQTALNRKQTLITEIIFLTMVPVMGSIGNCYVDISLVAWISLSVYTLQKAIATNATPPLIVSAFLAGMAMSTKIFGVFVLPLLLATALLSRGFSIRRFILFLLLPTTISLPWYLKSLIYKGTLLSIHPSAIHAQGLGNPLGLEINHHLLYWLTNFPLRILLSPWSFSTMPSQHQQDMLGPLFCALLPFSIILKLSDQSKRLLILSGIYLGMVLLMEMLFIPGGASIRYIFAIPLFCIPVCMEILKKLKDRYYYIYRVFTVLIVMQTIFSSVLLVKRYHKDWIALVRMKNRDDYYCSILPQYPAIKFINDLPGKEKVMTIFNFDNYLVKKPYISAYTHYASKEEMLKDMQKNSVSYIFANNVFDTASNYTVFYPGSSELIFSSNGFCVYKIIQEE